MVPAMVEAFTGQLRAVTERLEGLAGLGQRVPLPGALSAAQLTSIADSIAAQRHSIEALKAQLSSFDEQLAALEQILGPLAQWSATWADLEKRLMNMGRGQGGQGPGSGSATDSSLSGDHLLRVLIRWPSAAGSGGPVRERSATRRGTAQPPAGTLSTEASKICPIEVSSRAWNCSPVCWSVSPSSSAREKLAIMLGSRASNAHALSRL
jgi:hypothetical protein